MAGKRLIAACGSGYSPSIAGSSNQRNSLLKADAPGLKAILKILIPIPQTTSIPRSTVNDKR
ncbi:hypothetical protein C4K37_3955 [Pseudomonas chlororaphis subsp. piscium]|nr:hypothetical protein C4K37_3955 [Pseudomonas chlororaphis subsp. piscium]AZC44888.1 hypothetical protein C4K36_3966 [Pseudomonas chlororaphis subsp. piscium]